MTGVQTCLFRSDSVREEIEGLGQKAVTMHADFNDLSQTFALADKALDGTIKTLSGEYRVTEADGARGLWGILEHRLPEGLPAEQKAKAIQSLENLIAQKLDHMSPQELIEAGFPKGDINFIRSGDTIRFEKLFTHDELKSILEGKSVAPPAIHADISTAGAHGGPDVSHEPVSSGVVKSAEEITREKLHEHAVEEMSKTDPRSFLLEHPEQAGALSRMLGKYRMELFMTNDVQKIMEYDFTLNDKAFGAAEVAQVLDDEKHLSSNPFTSYDRDANPLHYSQMYRIADFVKAANDPKVFGPLGQVRAGETIGEYTRRMATLSLRTGKEIPGF